MHIARCTVQRTLCTVHVVHNLPATGSSIAASVPATPNSGTAFAVRSATDFEPYFTENSPGR